VNCPITNLLDNIPHRKLTNDRVNIIYSPIVSIFD
jgi:hypothetical protein